MFPLSLSIFSVLIISYDLFRMNSDVLSKSTNIGLLVVDEGHRLKNTSGTKVLSSLNSLKCNARLLITGTPIQNNLSEFYNVANFVLPGVLGSLSNFRKGKSILIELLLLLLFIHMTLA
jgi:DNA repair and recombination RAD54-like protein